jgi:CubicO group peptidase (beta-lactamase class C family)
MLQVHCRNFRAQHSDSALFSLILLVSLLLQTLLIAPPVQARHLTPLLPMPSKLGDPRELETFLDDVIGEQMRADHIPGATVSVVKDGRLLFAKGYGSADLQEGRAVNAHTTLFRIGSVSKLFTATAVLQLAEQGKLNLYADVNTYLKTFQIPATYPEPITLAHLLTHTAGFEVRVTGLQQARTTSDLEPLSQLLAEHMPARVRPPGELISYSNYGYALAGYIVEQVSGLPFEQYVEQHIFQPLGMHSSSFYQPVEARLSANLSQGYTYSNGAYRSEPFEAIPPSPAGAMSTTATDIANFMLAQLQNGRLGTQRILQAATAKAMQTQHFTNDPRVAGGMAYGFEVHSLNGQRLLVHPGGTNFFYSLLALLPEQHVGVFVSYNSFGGAADYLSYPFLQAFLDHYFPASQELKASPLTGVAQRISQINGTYWGTGRSYTTWEKLIDSFTWAMRVSDAGNGRLEISWLFGSPAPGSAAGPPKTFVEVAPWVFHQVDGPEVVAFHPDKSGMLMMRGSYPVMAFTKVAWYETPTFALVLLVACVLLFLSTLLFGLAGFARRIMKRKEGSKPGRKADGEGSWTYPSEKQGTLPLSRWGMLPILPRLANWLVGLLCALNVLLVIVLLLFLFEQLTGSPPDYYFSVPPLLTIVFILALVSAVLTVGVAVFAIPVWCGRFWSVGRRIHYSLVALAALALTWQLVSWNLLGFRA